jgi:hypothetical protein
MAYAGALREAGRNSEAAEQLTAALGHLTTIKGETAAQARGCMQPCMERVWGLESTTIP